MSNESQKEAKRAAQEAPCGVPLDHCKQFEARAKTRLTVDNERRAPLEQELQEGD